MTWLAHGATLAYKYRNAELVDEDDCQDEETEEVLVDAPETYLEDERVKAYALLKTTGCEARRISEFMSNMDELLTISNEFTSLVHKLYLSLEPSQMESVFNAIVNKEGKAPNYEGTKHANVHELNEYVRQQVGESVDSSDGFMYNISEVLDHTRENYISELATYISDLLIFFPDKAAQKRFITQFESGLIWRDRQENK
jgi:hypothetical protein